jgi:hypothetical protein
MQGSLAQGHEDRPIEILDRGWFHRPLGKAGLVLVVLSGIALAGALLPESGPETAIDRGLGSTLRPEQPPQPTVLSSPALGLRPAAGAMGWVPVRKPISIFNLEGPETEGAAFDQQVFEQGARARRDVLTWRADPASTRRMARPLIQMVIERFEGGMQTHKPLFADLAFRAAEAGIAFDRMNPAQVIMTKFGALEVADAMLATAQGQLACLVYRRIDTLGLTIVGWYCGSARQPADRVSLGCFVNRLDLMSAGQDLALRRFFAAAERNRSGCSGARQFGRKLTWLDHEAPLPPLKLSLHHKR